MSKVYDTVEPTIIDYKLLKENILSSFDKFKNEILEKDGIVFEDVRNLRLDYKNILKIDNMWRFESLVKLQLDNNIIEKIEGLEHLVHLKWLEKIEGLNSLKNLEDLILFNNRIVNLENMENLEKLHVLSIGNNDINDISNIKYLRQFIQLRSLTLRGNPICKSEEYNTYIQVLLPNLTYLDYRIVDKSKNDEAYEKYQYEIEQLINEEVISKTSSKNNEINEKEKIKHEEAFIKGLDEETIFDQLFIDDPEGKAQLCLPELYNSIQSFRENFISKCKVIFDFGLAEYEKRMEELLAFDECIAEAKRKNKLDAVEEIARFETYRKKIRNILMKTTDTIKAEDDVIEYNERVQKLWNSLMHNELVLTDQIEDVIGEFELNLTDMINNFIESIEAHFRECRDLQTQYHEKLTDLCPAIMERLRTEGVETPDTLMNIFIDRESITNSLAASNDAHLIQIDNMSDQIRKKAYEWTKATLKRYNDEKYERSRSRVIEINRYIDELRSEVENLNIPAFSEP